MKILVIAGEASADLHASHVIERLGKDISLVGIGGNHLIKLGLKPLRTASEMGVVGLTEALAKIPQTLRLFSQLEALAINEKPDFALLLDLPDFNLRMAPRLKRLGIPVIYYISPQVWAWRKKRVHVMAETIDLLLTILPFEKNWYEHNAPKKLNLEYVGHPVIEEIPDLPYAPEENVFTLMPGSRESEWRNLFGPMVIAAQKLHAENPAYRFLLPLAETMKSSPVAKEFLDKAGPFSATLRALGPALEISELPAHQLLRRSKAAFIASGTATLEAGVVGIPMVMAYKVTATTAFLFKHFIQYEGPIAMVNLIHKGLGAKDRLVPEVLQGDVNPDNLVRSFKAILVPKVWEETRASLAQTRKILSGIGSPIQNAADAIHRFLQERP